MEPLLEPGDKACCVRLDLDVLPEAVRDAAKAEKDAKTRSGKSRRTALVGRADWGGHDHDPREHVGDASLTETCWNIINLVVGGGVLSMPYACKLAGWAGLFVIALFAALFGFTAVVIGRVLEGFHQAGVPKENRDFAMLAEEAFGRHGSRVTALFLIAENWSAAIAYIIFVGDNVKLTTGAPELVGVVVSGVLSLAMLYMPLRWLSYVGMLGMLFAGISVATLVYQGNSEESYAFVSREDIRFNGLGTAGGIVLFCFAGHACLPNLYWSMRHPKQDYAVATVSAYTVICAFYSVAAAAGYFFYGDLLTSSFTGSLSSKHLQYLAVGAILVKIQAAVPPALAAPVLVIENMLGFDGRAARAACRIFIVLLSMAMAMTCSGALAEFVALSGYLTTSYDSLIFPALVSLALRKSTACMQAALVLTVMAGLLVAVVGTWSTLGGG